MKSTYQRIHTDQVHFDRENPRIKVALEKYGDKLNNDRIRFALQTATEGSASTSSYRALKDSIRAAGGISVPIVVVPKGDQLVCIDGNTRLTVYNELQEEGAPGAWTSIDSLVLQDPKEKDIETIRVTAHLVGAREWPAYEKARYLHYLRNVEFMDYDELIARCGGNRNSINQQIDAYHDMNEYYRDVSSGDAFKVDRFSGFVELQKKDIKESIYREGFDLHDFGRWIREGQIARLADVRKLPRVLADEKAQDAFVNGGYRSIEIAIDIAEANRKKGDLSSSPTRTVENASIPELAEALLQRIKAMPRQEYLALRDRRVRDGGPRHRHPERPSRSAKRPRGRCLKVKFTVAWWLMSRRQYVGNTLKCA